MKITIQLKNSQLIEIITGLQDERPEISASNIVEKTYFYLFNEVLKKLLRKQIDKADDYSGKAFKININYPHAAALYNELLKVRTINSYRENCCRILLADLRQKLS